MVTTSGREAVWPARAVLLAILSSPDPQVTEKAIGVMVQVKGGPFVFHHTFTQVNQEIRGAAHLSMHETRGRRGDPCRELSAGIAVALGIESRGVTRAPVFRLAHAD